MKLRRQEDMILMQIASASFVKSMKLILIHNVKIKLGISNVSEILSADGKRLDKDFLLIKQDTKNRNNFD